MIVFEFCEDTSARDGHTVYWLGCTDVTGEDEEHADEIYEQLMAHEAHLDEGF